jgi:hypothetical protein
MTTRVLAGAVESVDGDRLVVRYWTDPDTSEVLEVEVGLTPAPGLGSVAYVTMSADGSVVLGQPYAAAGRGVWAWGGTNASTDPGSGRLAVNGTGNSPRLFAVSKVDANGFDRNLVLVAAGDNVTITDDPAAPPITGFARYVVTEVPVDHGTYVTFAANRTDTTGSQNAPPVGTRLRVSIAPGSAGSSGGPFTVRFDTYADLVDGIIIGG